MPATILKYFMWGYQHHTRANIQRYAEELFAKMTQDLQPTVFLLGIQRAHDSARLPVCIEPENCGIDVNRFNDVDSLATSIFDNDPRRNMFHTMEHMQELQTDKLKRGSLRRAIQKLVDQNFAGKNKVSFVSESVFLEGYEIFVVLQFDERKYNSHYSLVNEKSGMRNSLIDSLIWRFLDESLDTMYRPRAAAYSQEIQTDEREVLRKAGSDFVENVIFDVTGARGTWEFFDTCNYIASLKYEGDSSIGKLVVCREDHPNIDVVLKLSTPIRLNEHRKVRKFLEVASEKLFLFSNGSEILGLTRLNGNYDPQKGDLVVINFSGAHKWELIHDCNTMMIVEFGVPNLPKLKVNRDVFDDVLNRIFPSISQDELAKLWSVVNAATIQRHGTLIIISSEAEHEAKRLENQSTRIAPSSIDDVIQNVTSIDGAVLLDFHGICHSIGVILDGVATEKGTSARGARYNSSVRYVENNRKKCVAVIISEDGMVDLYPQLLPRIRKNEIEERLEMLRNEVGQQKVDYEKYRPLMNWFSDHEFYLSKEECDEINQLKKVFDSKLEMELNAVYIMFPDFEPNPEMDSSYFYADNN